MLNVKSTMHPMNRDTHSHAIRPTERSGGHAKQVMQAESSEADEGQLQKWAGVQWIRWGM
jgi:hypothetical protein